MPNLSQFRVLIAVAEAGGIRTASERINRTVSAVSMTLKQLEGELGGTLFEGERKARLTGFGEFVLGHARSLVEHSDRVNRTIGAFKHNGEGSVEVAMLPSIASAFLSDALRVFTQAKANAELHIRDLDSSAIFDAVSRELVDWGIASCSPGPQVQTMPLFSEPLRLVCAADSPLCGHPGPVPWTEVAQHVFIGNGSYYELLGSQEFLGVVEKQRMHVRSVLSLLSLVSAGIGITVLPSLLQVGQASNVRFLTIDDPKARRTVSLLSRTDRTLSPAARQFAQVLLGIMAARAGDYGLDMLQTQI